MATVLMGISISVLFFFFLIASLGLLGVVHPSLIEHNDILDPTVKDTWNTTVVKSNLIFTKCHLFLCSVISSLCMKVSIEHVLEVNHKCGWLKQELQCRGGKSLWSGKVFSKMKYILQLVYNDKL